MAQFLGLRWGTGMYCDKHLRNRKVDTIIWGRRGQGKLEELTWVLKAK